MSYRSMQWVLFGFYLIHLTESSFIFNLTNTNKIFCHSCKGNECEQISNEDDNVIACNKHTQLCWAGFVDRQPYRTCASRFCTPSGISLDSDVRIETCCRTNLCNNIPLSWSMWSKWYRRSSTHRPETSSASPAGSTPAQLTTGKRRPATSKIYIVNELVNEGRKSSKEDSSEEQENRLLSKLKFNASNPATFGINWERIPYDKNLSNVLASISKLFILMIPILLILLF